MKFNVHSAIILLILHSFQCLRFNKDNLKYINSNKVNIIADEVDFNFKPSQMFTKSTIPIYNLQLNSENQEKLTIDQFSDKRYKGYYYKDPFAYYGPSKTYKKILEPKDPKFITNIIIAKNLEETSFASLTNRTSTEQHLKEKLIEYEKQLTNLMLFINEPKLKPGEKVNDKYVEPYYDPTYLNKQILIGELKKKIFRIKEKLNLPLEDNLNLYVEVNNSTFPFHSDDLAKNINKSYSYLSEKYSANNTFFKNVSNSTLEKINGNLTDVLSIYDLRSLHLKNQTNLMESKAK